MLVERFLTLLRSRRLSVTVRRPRTDFAVLLFCLLAVACSESAGEDEEEACSPGETGCDCSEAGACTDGAVCEAGTCVAESSGSGGSTPSGGGSGTGGEGLTGGGPGSGGANSSGGANGAGGTATGTFTLSSTELTAGGEFLDKHTCQESGFDNDESPPLAWSGAPEGTLSYVVTFIDRTLVDEESPLGYHWALFNLSADVTALPANLPAGLTLTDPVSATQSRTSYLGPCPGYGQTEPADPPHTYEFTVWALPTLTASVSGMLDGAMLATLTSEALGSATLSASSSAHSEF